MLRYAVLALIGLTANNAFAQQAAPIEATPVPPPAAEISKPVVPMEEPLPGDRWTYEVRDEITGEISAANTGVVTGVKAAEISERTKIAGVESLDVYDRSWNLISAGAWKYFPNDGTGIRMPLAVGKTWTFQSNEFDAGKGHASSRSGTSKVLKQEPVTTKAGTFETFEIETKFTARSVNDPTSKYETTLQTWYAPAIDHWVKRLFVSRSDGRLRDKITIELVEYGRR
jgi:hypothetical protein